MLVKYLRPITIVVLVLALIVGGVGSLEFYLKQTNVDCSHEDQKSANYKEHPKIDLALKQLVPSDYRDQYPADPKETRYECLIAKYTSELAIFTKVLAYATVFLGLATIGLLVAAFFQSRDMKKSLNLARDEFLSTHRPKIRIKNVWLINSFQCEEPIRVEINCVNIGTTDASLIGYGLDFLLVKKGRSLPANHKFALVRPINTVLKPGVTGPFPFMDQPIQEDTEIAVRNGLADYYCIGYLHYMDGANNIRTTGFCRKFVLDKIGGGSGRFISTDETDYEYEY